MLTREREQRPFDLKEVARVLRRYTSIEVPSFGPPQIRHDPEPERTSRDDATLRQPEATAPVRKSRDTPSRAVRPTRRGRLGTIGLGVLVITVLVVQSVMLWRSRRAAVPAGEPAGETAPTRPDARAEMEAAAREGR